MCDKFIDFDSQLMIVVAHLGHQIVNRFLIPSCQGLFSTCELNGVQFIAIGGVLFDRLFSRPSELRGPVYYDSDNFFIVYLQT